MNLVTRIRSLKTSDEIELGIQYRIDALRNYTVLVGTTEEREYRIAELELMLRWIRNNQERGQ